MDSCWFLRLIYIHVNAEPFLAGAQFWAYKVNDSDTIGYLVAVDIILFSSLYAAEESLLTNVLFPCPTLSICVSGSIIGK